MTHETCVTGEDIEPGKVYRTPQGRRGLVPFKVDALKPRSMVQGRFMNEAGAWSKEPQTVPAADIYFSINERTLK